MNRKEINFTKDEINQIIRQLHEKKGNKPSKVEIRQGIKEARNKLIKQDRAYKEREAERRKAKRAKEKLLTEEIQEKSFEWGSNFTPRR